VRGADVFAPRASGACRGPAPAEAPKPPAAPGIVRTGPGSFALDRSARDRLIDGAADLSRSVTVQMEKAGDDVVGLRIAALRPGTALDALDLRAGDVIASIDGIPLTAPDRMLEAYARVRAEEHVRIVIVRAGHEHQVDVDVR
jgi:general secretion pathway protein C